MCWVLTDNVINLETVCGNSHQNSASREDCCRPCHSSLVSTPRPSSPRHRHGVRLHLDIFGIMQILCFDQKIKNNLKNFYNWNTSSPRIESTTFISFNGQWHHCATGVLSAWKCDEILLFIEGPDYWSNFAKTILFENCSCFSKIPFSISVKSPRIFQCFISISAGHWVRQIDGDLPRRFFLSALLSLVISMTGRSERSARALRDGADVVREAIGN